ncbi:RNA polymerase sigma factor [Maribacter algarum]|uniref:RNA polymerase sigma factor n=1 Tax=Maribacter algarum (ex Zhang et al. 2020) TaxID=2578118 RepID=A0A5S3PI27_9FLAO|nr:RNA polymerase sigma factor [Maribacter algarum]TMM53935.1 RNA polymerase sigma factor [Maribacter algarum]
MTEPNKIFDGLLVLQYKSGSKKAMSLLVKRHHEKLCKHAYWYTHDMDQAKDITQECWSIILKKIETLKNPNLFGSWALRIVTRKSLNIINQEKRELQKRSDFHFCRVIENEKHVNKEEIGILQKAIMALNKDQQQVLRLFYAEDYSLKEISDILSISRGTVKSRLFHAREKLKKNLK